MGRWNALSDLDYYDDAEGRAYWPREDQSTAEQIVCACGAWFERPAGSDATRCRGCIALDELWAERKGTTRGAA